MTVSDASAQGNDGGGGLLTDGSSLNMTYSSVSENTANVTSSGGENGGGGLLAALGGDGTSTYLGSTLSDNSTTITGAANTDGGGAILTTGPGTASDLTIAGNTINKPAGGILTLAGFRLKNTIIADNSATPAGNCKAAGNSSFSSGGFNLESADTCGFHGAGDLPNAEPQLGPLQNNGGLTSTQALAATSPAVNAGSCTDFFGDPVATDQRGVPRPQPAGGNCDIGAYELIFAGPPTAAITSPADNQTYSLNQVVATTFSCVDAADGPGIRSCVDSGGATGGAGMLNTANAGPHTYTVTATSADGQTGSATIHYAVSAPPGQTLPAVSGGSPTSLAVTGASVSGTVNPEGISTQAFFQYGLDLSERGPGASTVLYDQSTPVQQVGSDLTDHAVTASLTSLLPGARYHVRLVATSAAGTTFGPDQTFTTAAPPPPRAPVLGQSQNLTPVSGTVFVITPSGQFVPLTAATQVPNGSIIDALHGSLQLVASIGKGKTDRGIFGGAIFRLAQAHSGLTTLSLIESAFVGAPSYSACRPARATYAQAAALSSRTLQLLHASARGRFRTSGRYSAATVRGTRWTIADRCDGTLTHDLTDSVLVSDFVRHRAIVLHAGQSYLARAPRRGK